MKKRLFILAFLSICVGLSAQNATDILDRAAKFYTGSDGVKTVFSMHTRAQQGSEGFEGEILIKGDKFVLKTPDMFIWFDGKTQWAYLVRSEEVNVTTPGKDDFQFINPAILLNNYKKGFDVLLQGESTATNGKTAYDILLTPKKKNDITEVLLQIEKNTGQPASIRSTSKDGSVFTVRIQKIQTGLNYLDSDFVFNPADFPNAEVIDLR